MSLRSIPADMDAGKVASIDAMLDRIADEHRVFLPLAVESGSRAWGFASPDSDYDCRFVYVRRTIDHITVWPVRDVIELPLEGDLDANGWDLRKALQLLLKGNAVIVEWLCSPVVYRGQAWFRDAFLEFGRRAASREAICRHYLHLGERQRRVYFGDESSVPQKKVFYALRPAAVLRWLRMHPTEAVAPMHFPTLMVECDPPAELREEVRDLMQRKAVTHELGATPLSRAVAGFIDSEFEIARSAFEDGSADASEEMISEALRFYRMVIERLELGPDFAPGASRRAGSP
ncbi:nucleotidyltransferase domain-containing protein [Bradyrhizobium sp. CER78]|uniref:nucleotidyltransferase domain-containing protein n=1 Tax=Bradyrhizobium sp. CER78 TaxID=3039162 RepID=UPI002447B1F5|nr:nucleotidyltransferase domain-containing protein [Bradyrhizobium sp. CER78]MDH2387174.1 nucleotidyltransferase domain-containing protein [Bradyrhizobium sp. CER78]